MNPLAIPITSMLLTATISLANPVHHPWTDGYHKPSHTKTQTATKNGSAHAGPRIPPKVKLLRSNPHRLTAIRFQDVDPLDAPDDEFLCSSTSRRPKVVHVQNWNDDDPISSYAETRLLLARHFAVKRHRDTQGQTD